MKFLEKNKKLLIILIAATAIFIAYAHFETYWLQVISTIIADKNLPIEFSGQKIAFISDIHCGENFSPKRLRGIISRLNSLQPDIVILGGDYADRYGKQIVPCFNELAKINAPLGKFAIMGNHDSEVGTEKIKNEMRISGITPLVNENRQIKINNSQITIAGTDETWYGDPNGKMAMENASPFTIYTSHDPRYLEQYQDNRAKILLAGHTHGGQVTLFGFSLANLVHRQNYKYGEGIFYEKNRTIIITNGIGATILPLRFFSRPQINLITLEGPK